jgi:nitrate/TMAO reductase-like tetraheme cytochrome c subunit
MWRLYRLLVGIITCHPIAKLGGYMVTFGTISAISYTGATIFTRSQGAYAGIIFLLLVPSSFFCGLALIPIGIYLAFIRACLKDPSLRDKSLGEILRRLSGEQDVRNRIIFFILFSIANVVLTLVIVTAGFEYMDSTSFCGLLCHKVMEPEYVVYQRSPHARVECVDCHIGPGASWFVRSKISGLRQVYAVLAGTYSRPIPTPIENLRPSRETCEQCHWPEKFEGNNLKITAHYDPDRNNTKRYTALLLKIGGPVEVGARKGGIHWHVSKGNRVIFMSEKSEREDIPWVRLESESERPAEYRFTESKISDKEIAAAPKRTMECVDCHNRPTHVYRTADEELDGMLSLWPELQKVPYLKKVSGEVLARRFDETAIQRKEVGRALLAWYSARPEEKANPALLEKAAEQVQEIYSRNVWPRMNITWGTYVNHIGHTTTSPGCLRCHDNNHVTAEGKAIRTDCRLCHIILALKEENPPLFDFMVHKEK